MKYAEMLKTIDGDVTIEKIAALFGDKDVVLNGIPKEKFNEKLGEITLLKNQLAEVNSKLDDFAKKPDMTEEIDRLKGELAKKDQEYKATTNKSALIQKLTDLGCVYPELILSQMGDLSAVDIEKVSFEEHKAKFPNMFATEKLEPGSAASTATGVNGPSAEKAQLVEAYNEAQKRGDATACFAIQDKIKTLKA